MRWIGSAAVVAAGVALLAQAPATAQVAAPALPASTRVAIAARSAADLAGAASRVDAMIATGELVAADVHEDTLVAGHRFETLRQMYRGVPVEGGSVTRQMAGAAAVSIIGTVFTGIDLDPVPALRPAEAAQVAEALARRDLAAGTTPELVVHPTPGPARWSSAAA